MTYFLDTSSWIKRYSGENGFEKIDNLIKNESIVIYDPAIVELISNLYRLYNEKYLTREELGDTLEIVYQDLSNMAKEIEDVIIVRSGDRLQKGAELENLKVKKNIDTEVHALTLYKRQ